MNSNIFTWDSEARVFHAEAYEIGWHDRPIVPATIDVESSKSGKTITFTLAEVDAAQGWMYANAELDLTVLIFK